jgi:hypothetical protein
VGPDEAPIGRHPISSDGAWIAISARTEIRLISTSGLPEQTIDGPAKETPRSRVTMTARLVRSIVRLDLATGKRTAHTTVTMPPESNGFFTVKISADGGTVAYSALTSAWDLFVIERAP